MLSIVTLSQILILLTKDHQNMNFGSVTPLRILELAVSGFLASTQSQGKWPRRISQASTKATFKTLTILNSLKLA